jgi:DNA-binding MarR family transcriptional regulator
MLGKSEIRLLQTLQKEGEGVTISTLSQSMGISLSRTSEMVDSLRRKGFVEVERINKKKLVSFADTKHAQLMKDLLGRFEYMDFSSIISGDAISVLWVLDRERSVKEISSISGVSRANIHRVLKRLMEKGVVRKKDSKYSLNLDFVILNEIAKEMVHYLHRKKARKLSPQATVVWEGLREFIVKAPAAKEHKGFHLTGPSKLGDYGVPLLLTDTSYYFYSEKKEGVDIYDVVIHTLLIDPKSTRYITYLLILLAKNRVDEKLLLKRAEEYGAAKEAKALINFLKSRGRHRAKHFPTWEEFSEKAIGYGVAL